MDMERMFSLLDRKPEVADNDGAQVCVCVCVCVIQSERARARERERESSWISNPKSQTTMAPRCVCVFVCVIQSERARESERERELLDRKPEIADFFLKAKARSWP